MDEELLNAYKRLAKAEEELKWRRGVHAVTGEVDRLKADLAASSERVNAADRLADKLRAELQEVTKAGTPYWKERDLMNAYVLEVARFREALRDIVSYSGKGTLTQSEHLMYCRAEAALARQVSPHPMGSEVRAKAELSLRTGDEGRDAVAGGQVTEGSLHRRAPAAASTSPESVNTHGVGAKHCGRLGCELCHEIAEHPRKESAK